MKGFDARRSLSADILGRGFDSHRLHQYILFGGFFMSVRYKIIQIEILYYSLNSTSNNLLIGLCLPILILTVYYQIPIDEKTKL